MSLYAGQTNLKIRLSDLGDISDYSSASIKYTIDARTEHTWSATVEDDGSVSGNGIIYYDLTAPDALVSGKYRIWAYIVMADARVSIGQVQTFEVKPEGYL
jgi:hypothetical protein